MQGLHDLRAASTAASFQEDPAWTSAEARVSPEMLQQMTSGESNVIQATICSCLGR